MRMICPNCNMEIDNDSNFCKYCGTKVMKANVCPKCGAPLFDEKAVVVDEKIVNHQDKYPEELMGE